MTKIEFILFSAVIKSHYSVTGLARALRISRHNAVRLIEEHRHYAHEWFAPTKRPITYYVDDDLIGRLTRSNRWLQVKDLDSVDTVEDLNQAY